MAEASREKDSVLVSVLACSICSNNYEDPQRLPKILKCHHSFCSVCLCDLVEGHTITCPLCRCPTDVPAAVADLPNDYTLITLLTQASSSTLLTQASASTLLTQASSSSLCNNRKTAKKVDVTFAEMLTPTESIALVRPYSKKLKTLVVDVKKDLTKIIHRRRKTLKQRHQELSDAEKLVSEREHRKLLEELKLERNINLLEAINSVDVTEDYSVEVQSLGELLKHIEFVKHAASKVKKEATDVKIKEFAMGFL